MNHVPITEQDKAHMLKTIGVDSVEALWGNIPDKVPKADLDLPEGLSETELMRHVEVLAADNVTTKSHACFLGAGAYDHLTPSIVRYIFSRGEFLTAYTPYQPEASQGTLQAMYEFQSILCDITGMDVANASLYEGASALAEGCLLATRHTGRNQLVLSQGVHPEYLKTLQTYLKHSDETLETIALDNSGQTDLEALKATLSDQTAAVVVQTPNAYGCLEQLQAFSDAAHEHGALFIVVVNPVSLGVLTPPGDVGADVVVGEGQPLGVELGYGGPYLGLFACKKDYMRKIPGRIIGMTKDTQGKRGYVLTLQTREQHIRRSKATSNICTNEAMMALAATVHLSALGKQGFQELAEQNVQKAHYLYEQLTQIEGVKPLYNAPFFNEFALEVPVDPDLLNERLLEQGFLGGLALKRWDANPNGWLVCATEARTRDEIDNFVQATQAILQDAK